jgi:hypothetical protein
MRKALKFKGIVITILPMFKEPFLELLSVEN